MKVKTRGPVRHIYIEDDISYGKCKLQEEFMIILTYTYI